ncbi:MAG: hypothetical protein DRN08_06675 [Thermoplasmata archaeon]|nr:MAG: hypothetical protein DRN08_06675 [Thermoplasmata archaeon]
MIDESKIGKSANRQISKSANQQIGKGWQARKSGEEVKGVRLRPIKMHQVVPVMLATMLLASFLLAVASFVSIQCAQAAPPQPLSCPYQECRWFNTGGCGDCYVYGIPGQPQAKYCRACDPCGQIPPCDPWWFTGQTRCVTPCP